MVTLAAIVLTNAGCTTHKQAAEHPVATLTAPPAKAASVDTLTTCVGAAAAAACIPHAHLSAAGLRTNPPLPAVTGTKPLRRPGCDHTRTSTPL
ncbi:hypothetical protein MAHJHV61_00640 [Mycobacterium avium subsp. hominissuis]